MTALSGHCFHGPLNTGAVSVQDMQDACKCPMRGCRAPECTAGDPLKKLKLRVHRSQQAFLEFSVELWTSPLAKDRQAAQKSFSDWQTARSRILVEVISKMAFWQHGNHDKVEAAVGAKACLELWKFQGDECKHRRSCRFLDPQYEPDNPDDPPLRGIAERMARGEDISHPDFSPLKLGAAQF